MYQLKEKEMIFVFTGPDGSGRKTVADMVGSTLGINKVLSYTTRAKRPAETDGQDYHFISEDEFKRALANDEFIEAVEIDGVHYGIKDKDIEEMFRDNDFIYLILNAEGARMLKQRYGEKVTRLFIYVDRDIIIERQKELGVSDEVLDQHFKHYDEDMAYMPECKHAFENMDLAHTVFAVTNVLEQYMSRDLLEKD
ncbi:guanylate kinase [Xylanibacillus composti]|uniref:Guanylate kinase n=1 Tax=Xylanibacillus composti TaxID=1572762 RepID=A0A8J4GZP3_9BACL|nr:guanylate kinase [Xylanibacillus composti]MDT9724937.1 guanylate kinase [Xylanibacillus composti]GIQ68173.1 guanylate kinase [Xylanibacillus composti]